MSVCSGCLFVKIPFMLLFTILCALVLDSDYQRAPLMVQMVKESAYQCRRLKRRGFNPCVEKILWRRKWQPTPVFLPRECHGQKSLAGYSPWSHKELATTEHIHTHTHTHTHTHSDYKMLPPYFMLFCFFACILVLCCLVCRMLLE